MSAPLSMREAAAEVGWCYDEFRKRWPELAADRGFPLPFMGRKWDRDAVAAWKLRQSLRREAAAPTAPLHAGANDQARETAYAQLQQLRTA